MKKKKYIWIFGALFFLAVGYFAYTFKKPIETKNRYITTNVEKGEISSEISASGNVIVDEQATVDPTIAGTVSGLAVSVGDQVAKGQFLFNILNDDLEAIAVQADASLQQSSNSVSSAELNLKEAKSNYAKAKEADDKDGDAYTTKELDILKEKITLAENSLQYARKNYVAGAVSYKNQKADAAKRVVVAPIAGTVQEINIKNGDDLGNFSANSSNESPITIGDLGTIKAEVEINEVDISKVAVGQAVKMAFDALPDLEAKGQVELINSLGNESQGVITYNVTISFDEIDSRIKPQMSVSATIVANQKKDVLVVPSSAIKVQREKSYVEILAKNDSKVEKKFIEIGISDDVKTEIVSGLEVGEKVVTKTISGETASESETKTNPSATSRTGTGIPGLRGMSGGPR